MTARHAYTRVAPSVRIGLPVRRDGARAGVFAHPRLLWHLASALILPLAIAGSGCKSKTGAAGPLSRNDPLMSDQRIPPTSVPLPEPHGGLGNRNRRNDPLLGSPTSHSREGVGASRREDVDRWKGTYIPSQATTPAALTATLRNNHSDLVLTDRPDERESGKGVKLQLAGGIPPAPGPANTPANLGLIPQVLQEDLKSLGIQRGDYELARLPSGEYAIRARVIRSNGTTTLYEEVGPSAAAATQKLIDQLRTDLGQ